MNEITRVLNPDEKVLWSGNPQSWPFLFFYFLWGLLADVVVVFYGPLFLFPAMIMIKSPLLIIAFIFFVILIMAIAITIGWLYYRVTYYAITNKRVILQSGIFGRSYKSVDFDKIQNASVSIGLYNYLFRTGTVKIFSGEIGAAQGFNNNSGVRPIFDQFMFIQHPDGALRILQDALSNRKEEVVSVLENIDTKITDNGGKV